jgi:7-cyano-7-deazaguanine synthase
MNDAILLLSGGIDSTTLLAQLSAKGCRIHALSFDYGQNHRIELDYARRNAMKYGVEIHHFITVDYGPMAEGSLLTSSIKNISGAGNNGEKANSHYVPGRNLLLLSHAAAYAEAHFISNIFLAVNADDSARFPDCSQVFLDSANAVWQSLPNTRGLKLHSPYLTLSKAKVIALSREIGVDLSQTLSCYSPLGFNNE